MYTAADVQALRQKTGAGMMDCKKALDATTSMDEAVEYLRAKGHKQAAGRTGREAREGGITNYVHHDGRIGVLVEVNCETDFVARTQEFRDLGRDLALQVASTAPLVCRIEDLDPLVVERERRVAEAEARASGKPEAIIGRIVAGKIQAFYKEVVLLEQAFVREPKTRVGDLVRDAEARLGERIVVRRFVRYAVGG